jgi:hypothetical protein
MPEISMHQIEELKRLQEQDITDGRRREERINLVDGKLDSMHRWRMMADRKFEKYDHTLFGNGEPGWDEMLRRMNTFMDRQEKAKADAWSDAKKFAIGALAFVVNTVLAIGIARMFP